MVQVMEIGTLAMCAGKYLKRELKSRKITQETFADMVGYEPRTVRRWLHDGIHKLENIEEVAVALNVTVWDIFAEAGMSPHPKTQYVVLLKRVLTGHLMSWKVLFFRVLINLQATKN